MRDARAAALWVLLAVQVAFATLHVVGKIVLAELAPLAFAGTRVAIATPVLPLLAWHHDRFVPARFGWPRFALLGLLGIFANQTLFLLGLDFTTATSSAILRKQRLSPSFEIGSRCDLTAQAGTARRTTRAAAPTYDGIRFCVETSSSWGPSIAVSIGAGLGIPPGFHGRE
jgi:hypothetical protein